MGKEMEKEWEKKEERRTIVFTSKYNQH